LALTQINAAGWSEKLTIHEGTQSPDGSYGIVVSTDENEETDYLADLKRHRLLGKIEGFDYVEGQYHGGVSTVWSPDSSLCVATQRSRFTFDVAAVLESNTVSLIFNVSAAELEAGVDSLTAVVALTPSGVETTAKIGADAATVSIVLSLSSTEFIIGADIVVALVKLTPSGLVEIIELIDQALVILRFSPKALESQVAKHVVAMFRGHGNGNRFTTLGSSRIKSGAAGGWRIKSATRRIYANDQ
jgi:hypothetical protein